MKYEYHQMLVKILFHVVFDGVLISPRLQDRIIGRIVNSYLLPVIWGNDIAITIIWRVS